MNQFVSSSLQIVLVPATDSIPIFQVFGYLNFMKNEFLRYRCREKQLTPYRPNYPEFCKKLTFSISTSMLHRALRKSLCLVQIQMSQTLKKNLYAIFGNFINNLKTSNNQLHVTFVNFIKIIDLPYLYLVITFCLGFV